MVVALLVVRSLYTSFFFSPSSGISRNSLADQIMRTEESIRIRREMEPLALVSVVRNLRKKLSRDQKRGLIQLPQPMMYKLAYEILESLQGLNTTNVTEQQAAVNLWRIQKLEVVRKAASSKASNSSIPYQEAKEIIPGRPMPPECHAELHTDYDGAAVRWGLTHHKESAADCCQACLDQAKSARPGQMKCNIWVYCPSEFGCHSPDIYEHKHQECWLKQADTPRLNFKGKYSESYRNNHPNAPIVVPWMSGVVHT